VEVARHDPAGTSSRPSRPGARRIVVDFLLGVRPDAARTRYPRALRTSWKRAVVTSEAVQWRSRAGHQRRIERSRISRIELVQTVPFRDQGSRGTDIAVDHHLVIGTTGGVLLRVRDTSTASDTAMRARWAPLAVPTVRVNLPINRLKDARRRWPEAFWIVTAHPVLSTTLATVAFMYGLPRLM
jgi:hypothetical protein